MMNNESQCRLWYDVEPTDANTAIVSRVQDAAAYLRQRIYMREIRAATTDEQSEQAWARHRATFDWQTRITRARLARASMSERERQLIALRIASPLRAPAGAPIASQADAGHLPLFIAANEPVLL